MNNTFHTSIKETTLFLFSNSLLMRLFSFPIYIFWVRAFIFYKYIQLVFKMTAIISILTNILVKITIILYNFINKSKELKVMWFEEPLKGASSARGL